MIKGCLIFVNTVNSVNIVNILDLNAITYKKQYNDSHQVLVSRQTHNSIGRDNLSVMYPSNSYSWNYKLFLNFVCIKKIR